MTDTLDAPKLTATAGGLAPTRAYYGWRARLGYIMPSVNVTNEPELWRMMPPGVVAITTKVFLDGPTTQESYRWMAEQAERAARELATAEVDLVAYACTAGSVGAAGQAVPDRIAELCRVPVITTANSVVEACRVLGVRRISVATPYVQAVNETERQFFEQHGLEVVCIEGMEIGHTPTDRRTIAHQPPARTYGLARAVDRPEAEAVFISCTNLPTIEILAALERDLGKPVFSSNLATFWAALRRAGVREPIHGYGRLLEI